MESERQLEVTSYVVLGLGVAIAWIAVANDLSPFRNPSLWPYAWMALPFGLAAVATRWLRGSEAALEILVPIWIVCTVGGSLVAIDASFVVVSDMSGLVFFAPPYVQIPIMSLAIGVAWWRWRREP